MGCNSRCLWHGMSASASLIFAAARLVLNLHLSLMPVSAALVANWIQGNIWTVLHNAPRARQLGATVPGRVCSEFRQLHSPAVVLDSDQLTQLPTWSCAQEPSSETAAFAPPDLLHGTVSQMSSTLLLALIYSNAISKPNFSHEHIVTNFVTVPGCFCTWCYTNPFVIIIIMKVLQNLHCVDVYVHCVWSVRWQVQKLEETMVYSQW